jgi:hypothetical protein
MRDDILDNITLYWLTNTGTCAHALARRGDITGAPAQCAIVGQYDL